MPVEIRCPACVPLGYEKPRFIFSVHGVMVLAGEPVYIQFHCKRCRSDVQWVYGTELFETVKPGEPNHKRQRVAFE